MWLRICTPLLRPAELDLEFQLEVLVFLLAAQEGVEFEGVGCHAMMALSLTLQ